MKKRLLFSFGVLGAMALAFNAFCLDGAQGALHFSAQPDEAEIFRARVFDEPLLPISGKPTAEENKALADAMSAYAARTNFDDLSSFGNFLQSHPDSVWTGSLLLHLGVEYYNYGYYSKALDTWEQAWQNLKNITSGPGKPQADRSLGELARMYSKLGRMGDLSNLLVSVSNRSLSGPGTQLIHSAQSALWMMQKRPEVCFRCGPLALDEILAAKDTKQAANPLVFQSKSTTNGISLTQVAALSTQLGMNYQMAFRSAHAPIIVPSVIHWKVGHYAALLATNGERYLIKDHTFQSSLLMSDTALNQEASGYFLVPPGVLPGGWRTVSDQEAQTIWGKGNVDSSDPTHEGPTALHTGGNAGGGCGLGGMTAYTMNTMLASLNLNDTPLGYNPPVGPPVEFTAYYNQNEAHQVTPFYYSNLGSDWDCNWVAYITDNPGSPGVGVTSYGPGGGTLTFSGFMSANQTFSPVPVSVLTIDTFCDWV